MTYTKEFDKYLKENSVQGHLRSNSIIMCQMIFTSDQEFFNRIGEQETKRYFEECYNFICNYKNLGEKNIISAVVHLDEGTPHMHLIYVPVVHIKDDNGNDVDKICSRDFWKGRDSYRKLQDAYFKHLKEKNFDLERGIYVEETNRQHFSIEEYKHITNYSKTKETLKNIELNLPETLDLKDIKKVMINRDEKIESEIIKPRDDLIQKLYKDTLALHTELSKQSKVIDEAEKYQKERNSILANNKELHNQLNNMKSEYKKKEFDIEHKYQNKIKNLEEENNHLHKIIDKFYETIDKFIIWICHKFGIGESQELVRNFEKETNTFIDPVKQIKHEEKTREYEIDL